ncbi:MAG: TOBE domain-containing protein, partial [Gemmatimonadetes bacterium]|nr:TOBE domain-containing protein [Gemmatimonadota bacterium]
LDEPLSNLDAKLRIEMRAELARLHQRLGVTMVYVTHDQEEAMTLGDRVAVLEAGFLKQVAPPMELYGHPSTRFVAGFIGSPEMNLYDGTLHAEGDAARFDGAGVSVPAPRPSGVEEAARVTLGVRPQEVQLVNGEAEGSVPATVGVVEPIGSQQIVHCRTTEDERLVVVAPIDVEFEEGSDKRFAFPVDSIHLFDAGTGERLE